MFGNEESFHLFSDQKYLVKCLCFSPMCSYLPARLRVAPRAPLWLLAACNKYTWLQCSGLCSKLLPSVYSEDPFVLALGSSVLFLYHESPLGSCLFKAPSTLLFLVVSILMISFWGVTCCIPLPAHTAR